MRLSRSEQDLTLTGTRPPSACSSNGPNSGRNSRKGYVKVANTSVADELLFSSSVSRMKLEDASFDAPWVTKKDQRQILLWSPAPSSMRTTRSTPAGDQRTESSPVDKPATGLVVTKKTPKIKDTMLKTRHPYRLVKNTPTFVDECLFGPRLEEPSFTAPWNVKVKPVGAQRPGTPSRGPRGVVAGNGVTKLDFRYRPRSAMRSASDSDTGAKPIWKP
ncbi:RBPJ-interacting and tubulin-associated protein 1-like [Liolophura sinensis]|uniref:RBPJ-interacting and tubulin-associated protein 1-like n=1 Tax=Liolophura sinensis TaxID=3198878 RepID=UPI0031592A36